jgi:hypothetical protein
VPLGADIGRGGILMPKPKHHFRVRVFNFGPIAGGVELSQQVMSCARPTRAMSPVAVHSYNSIAYYAAKAEWNSIELTVRDDVTNSVNSLVSTQLQKQMNAFEQTSPLAGSNYKFQLYIETLDGGDTGVIEQWFLEGCFLESVNYDSFDYSSSEPMTIQMTVRYDNATSDQMPQDPSLLTGSLI